ncbi:zf-HC2 domain-containing protein [Caldithrix abyssi]
MNLSPKSKKHFECEDIEKYIQQYLDNMLDEEKKRLFEEHIEYCLPCDKKVEFEKKFKEVVRLKVKQELPKEVVQQKIKFILKSIK